MQATIDRRPSASPPGDEVESDHGIERLELFVTPGDRVLLLGRKQGGYALLLCRREVVCLQTLQLLAECSDLNLLVTKGAAAGGLT